MVIIKTKYMFKEVEMIILPQSIKIKWNFATVTYYKNLGYEFTQYGDLFDVSVLDLPRSSAFKVKLLCDYCLENNISTIFEKKYYVFKNEMDCEIKKNCCKKCKNLKIKESNFLKFGVSNHSQLPESRERIGSVRRLDYEDVYLEFQSRGYQLLDTEYRNNQTLMSYVCMEHPEKQQRINLNNLKQGGHGCTECAKQTLRNLHILPFNTVVNAYQENSFILEIGENEYRNVSHPNRCRCIKHINEEPLFISYSNLVRGKHGCRFCYKERSLNFRPNWLEHNTLKNLLRTKIKNWKLDSMKACNYKCVVTGERFDDIHHLVSFNKIIEETLNQLNFNPKNKDISTYSDDQLTDIVQLFLKIHNEQYLLGVCLKREVHNKFHEIYGYHYNTPEQFEEFKLKYNSQKKMVS